jgi:CRP-like cAMP-binding protein
MPELDPATLTERVLRLSRSFPFDLMPVEDVSLIAAAGREQGFPTRTVLVHAGERSRAHYVQLAGRLRVISDHLNLEAAGSHPGIGALSVLGRVVVPGDVVAEPGTVLLVLDRDSLLGVLEERGHLARTLLRILAIKLLELRRGKPSVPHHAHPPVTPRLDLVSRMLLLRDALGLGSDGMATIAQLARVAHAKKCVAGSALATTDVPADLFMLLEGSLTLATPGAGERSVQPGEVLGLVEAVAGVPMAARVTARTDSTGLVITHAELAENIEDEDRLSFELIRTFAAEMWTAVTGAPVESDFWTTKPGTQPAVG